jgi:hypothetical protein
MSVNSTLLVLFLCSYMCCQMCVIVEDGNSQNGSYGRGALIAGFDCTIQRKMNMRRYVRIESTKTVRNMILTAYAISLSKIFNWAQSQSCSCGPPCHLPILASSHSCFFSENIISEVFLALLLCNAIPVQMKTFRSNRSIWRAWKARHAWLSGGRQRSFRRTWTTWR